MASSRCCALAVGFLLVWGGITQAETVTLDPATWDPVNGYYGRGFYDDTGAHDPNSQIYTVGMLSPTELRNFFVFDLTGIADKIRHAWLRVHTLAVYDGDQTYNLYDVTTSISKLITDTSNLDAFDDLGTGTTYGSYTISGSAPETNVDDLPLNDDFVNDAKQASGLFAIGGALTLTSGDQYVFGSIDETPLSYSQLVVDVPEPGTLVLLLIGALSSFVLKRRRVG